MTAKNALGKNALGRYEFKAIHVNQAEIGDLQVRNDREGEKRKVQERLGEPASHGLNGRAQSIEMVGHSLKRLQAHEAGKGQGQLGQDAPTLDGDESSAQRQQPIDGHRHILVVRAHHAEVVTVMPDRGGKRPRTKAKALDKPAADVSVTAVALEHTDFEQIVFRIGMPVALPERQVGL